MQINIARREGRPNPIAQLLPFARDVRVFIICVTLALVTFAIYFPVLNSGFVNFDDHTYVTDNAAIQNGLTPSSLIWAFTTGHASNWHPVTWISHMIDWQLFGMDHPGGHHLTNLLLHVANSLLLFVWLNRVTGKTWRSAAVAAFFAWHPLHVESVAWIAERKDVLSTFFWLLTALAYHKYVLDNSKTSYWLALFFFALGLMSKPMVVTLPFVLLLLDFWPLRRNIASATQDSQSTTSEPAPASRSMTWPQLLLEKLPFFLLAFLSCVITFMMQQRGGAVLAMEKLSLTQRIVNSLLAYTGYLRKMIWPNDLAVFYPLPSVVSIPGLIFAVLLLVLISVTAITLARSRPYLLFGWLWFLGTLVPVIGLVQVGAQSMADRYTYMPLVGIFIAGVWGLADLAIPNRPTHSNGSGFILILLLAACLPVTWRQTQFWKNSETLFTRNLAVVPDNALTRVNLGGALDDEGRPAEAMKQFEAALQLEPHSALTLNKIGVHYSRQGDVTNTIRYYQSALRTQPLYGDAHFNMGNALAAQGKYAEAAEHYSQSLQANEDLPDAHNNLGAVLMRLDRLPEALAQFKAALRLKPNFPEAQYQMGNVLLKLGHPDLAQFHYEEAARLKPNFALAHLKLGLVLAQQSYLQEALVQFQQAVKLQPQNEDAWFNLGAGFAALKRWDEAAAAFAQAVRQSPTDADARRRFAESLAAVGHQAEAIQAYHDALRLQPDAPESLRGLAWILATSQKTDLRNGTEAMRLAERANELTSDNQPAILAALDAAYAEAGRFDDAIRTAGRAQTLATNQNQTALATQAARRLELYRAGKPFHE